MTVNRVALDPEIVSTLAPSVVLRCAKKVLEKPRSKGWPKGPWQETVSDIGGRDVALVCEIDGEALWITKARLTKKKGKR